MATDLKSYFNSYTFFYDSKSRNINSPEYHNIGKKLSKIYVCLRE